MKTVVIAGTRRSGGGSARDAAAAGETARRESSPRARSTDVDTAEVLRRINAVNAYEVPDLDLRKDDNYAQTSEDVEPFGGVKPYKEHFLLQMEYTGPGPGHPRAGARR